VFSRERNAEFIKPLFSVVDPEKANSLVRQYRGIIFPEEKYNDLEYVNKAREMFKKLQNVHFYIKPAGE
jgi:GTP1/Obg family GTP-binding protein